MGAFAWNPNDFSGGGGGGGGDVTGPASSTNNAIVRFDGTTGKLLQNSLATISDVGELSVSAASSIMATFARSGSGSAAGIKIQNTDAHWWTGLSSAEAYEVRYNGDSAGSLFFSITAAGSATVGAPGSTLSHTINGSQVNMFYTSASAGGMTIANSGSGNAFVNVLNLSTGAAGFAVTTASADAYSSYAVGATSFSIGIDATDSNAFKVSNSLTLGTNDYFRLSTAGAATIGAPAGTQQHALNTATATSATAGSNGDVPAQVDGYVTITINGATKKIPYYAN